MTPGVYDVSLNVVCAANNLALATAKVTVTDPVPSAYINAEDKVKENRKIAVDGSGSTSPDKYPMDWAKATWKIQPVTTTSAKWEFGVKLPNGTVRAINQSTDQSFLNGQNKFDFQARYAGQYKITLTVTNSLNLTSATEKTITVTPDQAPVASFSGDIYVSRDQMNPLGASYQKWGIGHMLDKSTSLDGDTIKTRIWGYKYNSNNDQDNSGKENFADEVTRYKYTGNLSDVFYQTEGQRLVVENDNDLNIELWSYDVGAYIFELTVIEDIPDSETIKELLVNSDYKRGYLIEDP